MTAMIDARCSRCGRRFGWCGSLSNQPACPKCGHRPPQAELDAAEADMQARMDRLLTHPKDANADMRQRQRVDAGLTLRQAAKLLGIAPLDLASIERGELEPALDVLAKMAEVYGVG